MQKNSVNSRFTAPTAWLSELFSEPGIFSALAAVFPLAEQTDFPSPQLLTLWLHQHTALHNWSFVDSTKLDEDGRYYEDFISQSQQIPMRANNWHDLFGALIWCLFPKSKQLMNQLHMAQIQQFGNKERTKVRHKLTLLDECGVLLCIRPSQRFVLDLLRDHQWLDAFYQHKEQWEELNPLIFGHANYEMATKPFIGLTGKLWCIELPEQTQIPEGIKGYNFVDELLVKQLVQAELLLDNQQLSPLPLLGVPGWYKEQEAAFYADTSYFRPKRHKPDSSEATEASAGNKA
ncbi:MAG TPA: DUF3025 domain-containing protein [Rheinheimera sp.]|uniref:DUF3025 domain-containing protein n=1 Tax=Rheinheimera sp. TaxID=1869214 RepID=UPI002B46735A|nr:DUF3025 domain-containing protein [Rheinheimera sp.]HJS15467.1 DUF3025 domain-containing protein [Rheinheimera sp.]